MKKGNKSKIFKFEIRWKFQNCIDFYQLLPILITNSQSREWAANIRHEKWRRWDNEGGRLRFNHLVCVLTSLLHDVLHPPNTTFPQGPNQYSRFVLFPWWFASLLITHLPSLSHSPSSFLHQLLWFDHPFILWPSLAGPLLLSVAPKCSLLPLSK